ncbi:hypothetical protein FB567DRAFT_530221 [Paraphoma chrysanthemicola]|uniref:Uncharacterized protein n=1 Tax=Paraphoma chrysanthemicola TaxID=798071 RepID=A0A8K0R4U0_9PLEO|nr:hypothetical protein FB567DRAFT_530221 [Paraphoma chrysanthemicola]
MPLALHVFPGLVPGTGKIFCPESPRNFCMRDTDEAGIRALAIVRQRAPNDELLQRHFSRPRLKSSSSSSIFARNFLASRVYRCTLLGTPHSFQRGPPSSVQLLDAA